ncbi:hypothetical protein DW143_15755 [Bacillus sonorensis]|nr:hypothetical protein DW143_15755 [Bacillus sonorensis]
MPHRHYRLSAPIAPLPFAETESLHRFQHEAPVFSCRRQFPSCPLKGSYHLRLEILRCLFEKGTP